MIKTLLLILYFISTLFSTYYIVIVNTYGVSLVDIACLAILFYSCYRLVWLGKPFYMPTFPMLIWLLCLSIAVCFSAIVPLLSGDSEMQVQWIKTTLHFFYVVISGISFLGCNFSIKNLHDGYKLSVYVSILVSTFGIYQIFARAFDLPFAWITMSTNASMARGMDFGDWGQLSLSFGSFFRATSFFSEPSSLAGYTTSMLALLIFPYLKGYRNIVGNKVAWIVALMANSIALLLTFSLTGLLIAAIFLLTYFISEKKISIRNTVFFFLFTPALLLLADSIVEYYTDTSVLGLFGQRVGGIFSVIFGGTIKTTGGESFFGRADTIFRGFEMWLQYPITGYGLGCTYLYDRINVVTYIDSTFSSVLAETGSLGGVFFIALFVSMFRYVFITIRKDKHFESGSVYVKQLLAVVPYFFVLQVAILNTTMLFTTFGIYQTFALIAAISIAASRECNIPVKKYYILKKPIVQRIIERKNYLLKQV